MHVCVFLFFFSFVGTMHAVKYRVMMGARYQAPPKRTNAPRRQDSTRYIVAEIYGCYRVGWASFSLCAIALAASSQGLIKPTVPKGAHIVSAFDLCPLFEEQSTRSIGGLVYDAIVVVAAWPGRPRTDWVSVQFRDDGDQEDNEEEDDDTDNDSDGNEDKYMDDSNSDDDIGDGDDGAVHTTVDDLSDAGAHRSTRQRVNVRMTPSRDLMVAAARAAGDDLDEIIDAIAQHPQFPLFYAPSGPVMPNSVRFLMRTKKPKIDGAFVVSRNGFLALDCQECRDAKPRCPSCVGVWNRTRRLWPPTYDDSNSDDIKAPDQPHGASTRRLVPLRQSLRRVASAIAATQAPIATAPAPAHPLATTTTTRPATTAAQRAPRMRVHGPGDVPTAQRVVGPTGQRCFVSGARCGRHRCPSPCRRVDTESATHVRAYCDRGCRALFHRACWRAMGDVVPALPGLAGQTRVACLTPDCWGHLVRVVSFAAGASTLGRVEWEEAPTKGAASDCKDAKSHTSCTTPDSVGATHRANAPKDDALDANTHAATRGSKTGNALCRHDGAAIDIGDGHGDNDFDDVCNGNDDDNDTTAKQETAIAATAQDDNDHTASDAIDLSRPAAVYRKSASHNDDTRTQPKRTRLRSQKKQRLRARQKQTLAEWHDSVKAPEPKPWAGDDALWPTFFVPREVTKILARPRQPPPTSSGTSWRFAVWDPMHRTVIKEPTAPASGPHTVAIHGKP
nr:hypothetical protein [Pandoravirus massiliensis]